MSWKTGKEIFAGVYRIVEQHIDDGVREEVIHNLIDLFESYDCDSIYEVGLEEDIPEVKEYYAEYFYDFEEEEF